MCVFLCVDEACLLPEAVAGTGTGTAAEYIGALAGAASLVFLDKATCML